MVRSVRIEQWFRPTDRRRSSDSTRHTACLMASCSRVGSGTPPLRRPTPRPTSCRALRLRRSCRASSTTCRLCPILKASCSSLRRDSSRSTWWKIPRGCVGSCCCSSGVDPRGFYPICSGFRMRVSAARFAGHASGGPPAAARVRDAELRGGYLGHAAKADDLQLKVGRTGLHFRTSTRPTRRSALPQRTDIVSSTTYVRKGRQYRTYRSMLLYVRSWRDSAQPKAVMCRSRS